MCEKGTNTIVFIYPNIVYIPKEKNAKNLLTVVLPWW